MVEKDVAAYKETIAKISTLRSKVEDVLIRRISELEKSDKAKSAEVLTQLKELKDRLKNLDWRELANDFTLQASETVSYVKYAMEEEMESDTPNMNKLRRLNGYLVAFDVISDIANEISANKLLSESMKTSMPFIDSVIRDIEGTKKDYKNFIGNIISKKLSSLSNVHTQDAIKRLLEFGDFDISYMERVGYFMGDSKDPILSLVAKTVNQAQQKTRLNTINFNNELLDITERLEAERAEFKHSPEKLYDPILVRDSKGNLTGDYIKKGTKAYKEFAEKYKGTALLEFYEFFNDTYKERNNLLPQHYDMGNRPPTIFKGKTDRITSSINKIEEAKQIAREAVLRSNTDTARGQLTDDAQRAVNQVPILYTQSFDSAIFAREKRRLIKEGVAEDIAEERAKAIAIETLPTQISYDLSKSLLSFYKMAENYDNMMEIIDTVEGSLEALRTRKVSVTDNKGVPLLTRVKGLNDKRIVIDGSESNAYAMAESYITAQVYGQSEDSAGTIDVFGPEIDVNKLLGLIKGNTSMLMLGLNLTAATSNILLGEGLQWAESLGGEFWKSKDYAFANKYYVGNMFGIIEDLASRRPKNKMNVINEYYNVLGDYMPGGVGAGQNSKLKRSLSKTSIYVANNLGEHSIQSKAMIAFMHATETFDAEGNSTGNLWDVHEVENGKMTVKPGTFIKKDGVLFEYTQEERDRVSRQIQFIMRKTHGNYNPETAAAWQKNAYLQLIGQFRKWILDGYSRRWSKSARNEFMEQDIEGTYRSFFFVARSMIQDFRKEGRAYGENWNNMTAHQKSNAVKTAAELATVVSLAVGMVLLRMLASSLDEDDDKYKLATVRNLIYLNNRLSTELMFFTWPPNTYQILKSPAASMGMIKNTSDLLEQALPWNVLDRYESGDRKGDLKIVRRLEKVTPVVKQFEMFTPEGIKNRLQYINLQ